MEDTSNLQTELQEIELAIAAEQEKIKRGEALERLLKNDDFKLVILDGYVEEEAQRLFGILTTPPGNRKDVLDTCHDKLASIRHFKEYIGTKEYPGNVRRAAESAEANIEEQEAYRREVTAQGDE